jgi:enoyl-CoA hydratase
MTITYANFDYIDVSVDGGIAVVRMLEPVGPDFYELLHPMHTELRDIFIPLRADPAVHAVVITGTGSTFFGGPPLEPTIKLLSGNFEAGAKQMFEARQIITQLLEFEKPLVAAVNGAAISLGCQLALLCDFVVASTDATFQDTHVRLGLPAGDGGTVLWPLLVGMAKARSLLLRGHPLSAVEAQELGLIAELVPPEETIASATALAERLARLPRYAYAATRLGLNQWFRLASLVALDLPLGMEMGAFSEAEFKDGSERARRRQAQQEQPDSG